MCTLDRSLPALGFPGGSRKAMVDSAMFLIPSFPMGAKLVNGVLLEYNDTRLRQVVMDRHITCDHQHFTEEQPTFNSTSRAKMHDVPALEVDDEPDFKALWDLLRPEWRIEWREENQGAIRAREKWIRDAQETFFYE
jgi:hypothetical protein